MKRRRQRYSLNGRRLFVTLVVVVIALALVVRHRVERALGLRTGHIVSTLAGGGKSGATGATKGSATGKSAGGASTKGGGVSVSGASTPGQGSGTTKGSGAATKSGGGTKSGSGTTTKGSGGSQSPGSAATTTPPVTSYPGAPAIAAFYAAISSGKTADAYALLAPGLTAQMTPNAFAQAYATVKSAQVQDLSLQSAGNFTRTFAVTVAFTLTSGTIETKNGTITVQDQSGGVGTPDWAISALSVAP